MLKAITKKPPKVHPPAALVLSIVSIFSLCFLTISPVLIFQTHPAGRSSRPGFPWKVPHFLGGEDYAFYISSLCSGGIGKLGQRLNPIAFPRPGADVQPVVTDHLVVSSRIAVSRHYRGGVLLHISAVLIL